MKSAILAITVAVGVVGFASSSWAVEAQQLEPHPAAKGGSASHSRSVELPSPAASHAGGASAEALPRPETGAPSAHGGQSTAAAKHSN